MGQLVTPEEAKKKWCRHGRRFETVRETYSDSVGVGAAAVNRGNVSATKCLGPKGCMSWDWWDEESVGDARRGYCGADGKPNKIGNEKGNE